MRNVTIRGVVAFTLLLVGAVVVGVWQWHPAGLTPTTIDTEEPFVYISDRTFWHRTQGEQVLASEIAFDLAHDLTDVPLAVGEWLGKDVPIDDVSALIMLQPEQLVQRLYHNDQGKYVWLTMIGSRQSRSFHPPVACYDANGWETALSAVAVPVADGMVHGVLVDAEKEAVASSLEQLSFYFYLFSDTHRDPAGGIVMFRVTSPRYGTTEETLAFQGSFIQHFFRPVSTTPPTNTTYQTFNPPPSVRELALTGVEFSHNTLPSGNLLGINLLWQANSQPTNNYQPFLTIEDKNGLVWSERLHQRPQGFEPPPPTSAWPEQSEIWDNYEIPLLAGTPPGVYDVVLHLLTEGTDVIHPFAIAGAVQGTRLTLGEIQVVEAGWAMPIAPQFSTDWTLPGSDITLVGYNQDRAEAITGDPLLLTFFWQKTGEGGGTNGVNVHLQSTTGNVVHTWSLPLIRTDYAPQSWSLNMPVRGQHLLTIPAGLPSDTYTLYLETQPLGTLNVQTPTYQFNEPTYEMPLDVTFAHDINLVGYTLTPTGTVTLVWQPARELATSYHVFVHVVDETGTIIGQSDGVPAGWTRPTTSWLSTEYIIDTHLLPPPAPGRALHIGLYNPQTSQRLTTTTGDFIRLPYTQPSP